MPITTFHAKHIYEGSGRIKQRVDAAMRQIRRGGGRIFDLKLSTVSKDEGNEMDQAIILYEMDSAT